MVRSIRQEIDDISNQIMDQLEVASSATTDAVMDHIDDHRRQLEQVRQDDAYERHLVTTLSEAKDAFEDGEWAPEYGDEGEDRLCTCPNPYCPLKQGTLPPAVRMADSLEEGITDYKTTHRGTPIVLLEAREQYIELAYEVKSMLQWAHVTARRDAEGENDVDEAEVTG